MKNKKTLLSLFALAGILNFSGCSDDLQDCWDTDTELCQIMLPLFPRQREQVTLQKVMDF